MSLNNVTICKIDDVVNDLTKRLDVLYWSQFRVDFNSKSEFLIKPLKEIGKIRDEKVKMLPVQHEYYYPFKITYKGEVVLKQCCIMSKAINKKVVQENDLVFSRINACRGAVGVIDEMQEGAICTNETHVYHITDRNVITKYLQIILRHPYYQDKILTQCTGASLERMRFSEEALLNFEVPIPSKIEQVKLIKQVEKNNNLKKNCFYEIEKLRMKRNSIVLNSLGIQLNYNSIDEVSYPVDIDCIKRNENYRLDFEFNRPSYDEIDKIYNCKYPVVKISNQKYNTKILQKKITSGSTPKGGIYAEQGIAFLQAQNVLEDVIEPSNLMHITKDFHESLQRSKLSGNEVLVTIAGTIGRAAVNTLKDGNVNQAIAVLRVNEKINPLYLCAFLNSEAGRIQFDKYRHDFGTPNINQEELGNLLVVLPPIEIQNLIAEQVADVDYRIKKLKKKEKEYMKKNNIIITQFLIGKDKYKVLFQKER